MMRPLTYAILERAVEEGVSLGWRRAHKHDDAPDEDQARDQIQTAVMGAILEVFAFDDLDERELPQ